MLFAMDPKIEAFVHESSDTTQWIYGYLPDTALNHLTRSWEGIVECIQQVEPPDWNYFLDTIQEWAYPVDCPDDSVRKFLTDYGQQMALNMASAASDRVGILHKLKTLMARSYPLLKIISDNWVITLYPISDISANLGVQQESWSRDVEDLARRWADREAIEVVADLEPIERDMKTGRRAHPRFTAKLCNLLARIVDDPLCWFEAFRNSTLPADTIIPFLEETIARKMPGWQIVLQSAFESLDLKAGITSIILRNDDIITTVRPIALRDASDHPELIANLVRFDHLTISVTSDLLNHEDRSFVGQLALALWQRTKTNGIPVLIRDQWERALLGYSGEDFWLALIFSEETDLSITWLKAKLQDPDFKPFRYEESISIAVANMTIELRVSMLETVSDEYRMHSIVKALVGENTELFTILLERSLNDYVALAPLNRPSLDSVWIEFAKLAIDHGIAPESIASFVGHNSIFSGTFADMYRHHYEQFEAILHHEDQAIRKVAEAGYNMNIKSYEDVREQEDD